MNLPTTIKFPETFNKSLAAGRGTQYGLRCGAGSALWTAYSNAN